MDNHELDEKTIVNEIEKIKALIKNIELRFNSIRGKTSKAKEEYVETYQELMTLLVYIGKLSKADDMKDVREMYELAARTEYPQSPKKAVKLFLKNYYKHTERFDTLKERCWKMVDKTIPFVYEKRGI